MVGEQAIVDLVDVGEVVGGLAGLGGLRGLAGVLRGGVGIVESHIVHEDAVETHRVEIRDSFYGMEVIAIALAQGEDSSTGAEDLFPRKCGNGVPGAFVSTVTFTGADVCAKPAAATAKLAIASADQIVLRKVHYNGSSINYRWLQNKQVAKGKARMAIAM